MGLRNLLATASLDADSPEWILPANQLLYQDIQQASRIESSPSGLILHTLAPIDLSSTTGHERSIITYEIVTVRREQWWVRRGRAAVTQSNHRIPGVLIGPADARISLEVLLPNGSLLRWGAAEGMGAEQGSWEPERQQPSGGFRYQATQLEGPAG